MTACLHASPTWICRKSSSPVSCVCALGGTLPGIFPPASDALVQRRLFAEIHEKKGYVPKGPDPAAGRGTYVNPKTDRGYHIDTSHPDPKGPHVGVHVLSLLLRAPRR